MESRRDFIKKSALATVGFTFVGNSPISSFIGKEFVSNRPPIVERTFTSKAVEQFSQMFRSQQSERCG